MFEQFNARQHQYIVMTTLKKELDFDYLMQAGVIKQHFPLHMPERIRILESWRDYKYRLSLGMLATGYRNNL